MTDIANLVIKADTSQVKRATGDLNNLSSAGRRAESSSQSLSSSFVAMRAALPVATIAYTAASIFRMSDNFTKYNAQLKLATNTQEQFNVALADVERIATTTQSDISSVSTLYARLNTSLRDVGVTQEEVARITENVGLALKVSGATANESSAAILQLSQAFASGTLRGDEFNAVNESAPALMRALADSIGVPVGALRELASQGKITGDVLNKAFSDKKLLDKFREQAKEVTTISGAWTVLWNEVTTATGSFAKSSGTIDIVTGSINGLSGAIKTLRTNLSSNEVKEFFARLVPGGGIVADVAQFAATINKNRRIATGGSAEIKPKNKNVNSIGGAGAITYGGNIAPDFSAGLGVVDVDELHKRQEEAKRIADEARSQAQIRNKELLEQRRKAAEEANAAEVKRLNVAIWVNEQIALSEQKKNDEIAMYTERRMDIEQKRANENFEEAQRIYKEQLDAEQKLVEESKKGFEDLERAIDGYAKNASAAMTDFIFGSKTSFGDMVNSMLKDLARLALQKSIFDPLVTGITGALGGSGGIGGFFKSLLPGFANGTEYVPKDMVANIHQGERVLTREENRNYSQGMGGNVSVNVNVNSDGSSSVQSDASFGKQLGNAIKATVQAELLKQKRQGGLLA